MFKSILMSIIMFSLLSCTSTPQTKKNYPNLAESISTSENYELIKLIDGSIRSLKYHLEKKQIIISSGSYLWKLDENGQLVDSIHSYGKWEVSGYYFDPEFYIDWIHTGDKNKKKYQHSLDGNTYSNQQLISLFEQADIVEFDEFKDTAYAYLINGDDKTVIDISNKRDSIGSFCDNSRVKGSNWVETCFKGFDKTFQANISPLKNTYQYKSESRPISVDGFKRRKYYLEEGLGIHILSHALYPFIKGYGGELPGRYWFGDALVNLIHNNEALSFRVIADNQSHRNSTEDEINFSNLHVYEIPNEPDLKILILTHLPYRYSATEDNINHLYEDNVGLYIVRKKTTSSPTKTNNQPWLFDITGINTIGDHDTWGKINFNDRNVPQKFYRLGKRIKVPDEATVSSAAQPQAFYHLPTNFTVNLKTGYYKSVFKLHVNQQEIAWFHTPDNYTKLQLAVDLDPQELQAAVNKLLEGQSKRKSISPLNLQLAFEEINKREARLKLTVSLKGKSITLTQQKVSYPLHSSAKIERAKVTALHNAIFEQKMPLKEALVRIKELSKTKEFTQEYVPSIVLYLATKISNKGVNLDEGYQIIHIYNDYVFPFIDLNNTTEMIIYNHSVIASQGLVAGIIGKNDKITSIVINTLLGTNFDISTHNNGTLAYNLACFYALNNNKSELLVATQRARELGKPIEQFTKDTDFTYYRKDSDFLKILNTQYENESKK